MFFLGGILLLLADHQKIDKQINQQQKVVLQQTANRLDA